MKKFDYFFSSLLITLVLFFGVCGFLLAEYNSAKYIPTDTPPLIAVKKSTAYSGELTLMGQTHTWDFSHIKKETEYLRKFAVIFPRGARITADSASVFYKIAKDFLSSVTVGDETASSP